MRSMRNSFGKRLRHVEHLGADSLTPETKFKSIGLPELFVLAGPFNIATGTIHKAPVSHHHPGRVAEEENP